MCVDLALTWLHDDSVKQWGQPTSREGQPQELVVLGTGKLGAVPHTHLTLPTNRMLFCFFSNGHFGGPSDSKSIANRLLSYAGVIPEIYLPDRVELVTKLEHFVGRPHKRAKSVRAA